MMDLDEMQRSLETIEEQLEQVADAAEAYDDDMIDITGHGNDLRQQALQARIHTTDALESIERLRSSNSPDSD